MIIDYIEKELDRRYGYGEIFYLASKMLSNKSEKDILQKLSLLYKSQIYASIVEQDLGLLSPEEIVNLYKEEIKHKEEGYK